MPYGAGVLQVRWPPATHFAVAKRRPPSQSVSRILEAAMAAPIGSQGLGQHCPAGARVLIVVSDATRQEPRAEMLEAVWRELPSDARVTIAIANGTHAPRGKESVSLGAIRGATVLDHDSRNRETLVYLGTTTRGTKVMLNAMATQADLIVLLGQIKPHYFAGFGAGVKALFPGLGGEPEIRSNHRLKSQAGSELGQIKGNPCRDDLEEVLAMVSAPVFLLNVVSAPHGEIFAAVAGCPRAAFRAGCAISLGAHGAKVPRSNTVVALDSPVVSASLYQASKMVAAVAKATNPGGNVILVAPCGEGIGGVQTVNEAIYRLGIEHRFAGAHEIFLVSDLPPDEVAKTYCRYAESVEAALQMLGDDRPLVVYPASTTILEVT